MQYILNGVKASEKTLRQMLGGSVIIPALDMADAPSWTRWKRNFLALREVASPDLMTPRAQYKSLSSLLTAHISPAGIQVSAKPSGKLSGFSYCSLGWDSLVSPALLYRSELNSVSVPTINYIRDSKTFLVGSKSQERMYSVRLGLDHHCECPLFSNVQEAEENEELPQLFAAIAKLFPPSNYRDLIRKKGRQFETNSKYSSGIFYCHHQMAALAEGLPILQGTDSLLSPSPVLNFFGRDPEMGSLLAKASMGSLCCTKYSHALAESSRRLAKYRWYNLLSWLAEN